MKKLIEKIFNIKTYYIQYFDRYANLKTTFIKARNQTKAEVKFYKKTLYNVICKISLV